MQKASQANPLKTVLTITVGFLVLYLLAHWKWAVYVSLVVGIAGLVSDSLSSKVDFAWMKLSHLLGLIVPNILLTIVFYFILLPLALVSRAFGKKDPLFLRNSPKSMFRDYKGIISKESLEKPW